MCKCCEEIEFWKENDNGEIEHKLYAGLVQVGFRKHKNKKVEFSVTSSGRFDLNYCPMCR